MVMEFILKHNMDAVVTRSSLPLRTLGIGRRARPDTGAQRGLR